MSEHDSITDPEIHEPKGISTAADQQVYVSDGVGSGAWTSRQYTVQGLIADISTAETVHVPIPYSGSVVKISVVMEGAITGSDATLDVKNNGAVSMGTLVVPTSGSGAGYTDSLEPVADNTVTDDDYVTVETDGASTNARKLWFSVVIDRD